MATRRIPIQFQKGDSEAVRLEKLRRLATDVESLFSGSGLSGITSAQGEDGVETSVNGPLLTIGLSAELLAGLTGVPSTRRVDSGNGLTGGGDLSANRTLHVGAGAGITVTADAVGLADDGTTNAKLANMAEATFKGRREGIGTGDPQDIPFSELSALIGATIFHSSLLGLSADDHPQYTAWAQVESITAAWDFTVAPRVVSLEVNHASDTTLTRSAAGVLDVEGHTLVTDDQAQTISAVWNFTSPPQIASIELGHASDTTLSRSAAGVLDVEGHSVTTDDQAQIITAAWNFSTAPQIVSIELGHASDTTLTRSAAGVLDVEGHTVTTDDQAQTISAIWTFTANPEVSGAGPSLRWIETDQGADEGRWRLQVNNKSWNIQTLTDANVAGSTAVQATRGTGTAISSIELGNTTDLPSLRAQGHLGLEGTFNLGTRRTHALSAGNNNDIALTLATTSTYYYLTPDTAGSILTGIAAPSSSENQLLCLVANQNVTPLFLRTLSTASSASNRFRVGSNTASALFRFRPFFPCWFLYDVTAGFWQCVGGGLEQVDVREIPDFVRGRIRFAKWFNTAWIEEGLPPTEVGTAAAQAAVGASTYIASMPRRRFTTATANNASAGLYVAVADSGVFLTNSVTPRAAGFSLMFELSPQTVKASQRVFYGLVASTAEITATGDPPTTNMAGFAKNTADGNLQFVRNDGAGGRNVTDVGITHESLVGKVIRGRIWADGQEARVSWDLYVVDDDVYYRGSVTTQLPAADTLLYPHFWVNTAATNTDPVAVEVIRIQMLPYP